MDCWFVGLLLCWSVGLLVCCCSGLLDSQPGPAECAKRSAAPPGCGVLDEPQVCQDLVVLGVPRFLFLSLSFASIFLFLTPPKPSPAPSAFRRAVHLFALPAVFVNFLCLFPHAKKHQKNQARNFDILAAIFQISNIFRLILGRSGSILGPSRASFFVIFGIPILLCFSGLLLKQIQKYKKTQSAQNTAPVHGFRGSTG